MLYSWCHRIVSAQALLISMCHTMSILWITAYQSCHLRFVSISRTSRIACLFPPPPPPLQQTHKGHLVCSITLSLLLSETLPAFMKRERRRRFTQTVTSGWPAMTIQPSVRVRAQHTLKGNFAVLNSTVTETYSDVKLTHSDSAEQLNPH